MNKLNFFTGSVGFITMLVALSACVPAEVEVDQEETPFAEKADYTITGIEPGAGIMINTETALEEYGLAEAGWKLTESSSAAMTAAVQDAATNNEPVVATLWEPHALFAAVDLRKLEDPKQIYNNPERTRAFLEEEAPEWADADVLSDVIATVTNAGFSDRAPAAGEIMADFSISAETENDWVEQYTFNNVEADVIVEQWMEDNADQVEQWLPGEETELGQETITIGIPPWPGAAVRSRVLASILEQAGYEVDIQEMDIGLVYTVLAAGDIDVTVAGWLPTTHADYWDRFSDDLEIAGVIVEQTWLGLVVPASADSSIQSIDDLIPSEQ